MEPSAALPRWSAYPAGCALTSIPNLAVADFNGDGIPDIALTCTGAQASQISLYVLLGKGDGTFATGPQMSGLQNMIVGDFNKDGKQDIVVEGATDGASIVFYPGNGDGTFGSSISTNLGKLYVTAAAVDINSDGYADLAFGNFVNKSGTTNTLDLFLNNQDGTFGVSTPGSNRATPNASITLPSTGTPNATTILVGNINGIGTNGLAVVDTGSVPGIYIPAYTVSGNTITVPGPSPETPFPGLTGAAVGSIVTSFSDLLISTATTLTVYANNGSGSFNPTYANLTFASTAPYFGVADANADGYGDVYTATTSATGSSLSVALISGSATATSAALSLPAGTIPLTAAWSGNVNFSGSTATGQQIVNAVASTVALTSSLNPAFAGNSVTFTATVSPPAGTTLLPTGSVVFSDGTTMLGTMPLSSGVATLSTSTLAVGSHTISAAYGGDSIFATSTKTLTEQINSNTPILTWATPAAITYGTALSATQLNATAANALGTALPGTFVYTPAAGAVPNAGSQTLSVTFTPTDTTDYTSATKTVTLLVNPASATISWTPAVASIVYGTALGAQQLNATALGVGGAAVAGNFVYSPASGAVLAAGTQKLNVVFTPTNTNYTGATGSASIVVTQATPALTWTTPAAIAYGIPLSATQLDATAAGVTGAALPAPSSTRLSPERS